MFVEQLFIKTQSGVPLEPCSSLTLSRGLGIEGDRNAQVGSPRQVLLVSRPVLDAFALTPGDLRENILLNAAVEQFTSGQVLQVGGDAQIRLTYWCEPCALLDGIRPGLARSLRGQRGFLGVVTRSGQIAIGDAVQVANHRFSLLPEVNRDRFAVFVARIPPGRVVRTSDLLLALGWTAGFYRTIPTLIKKAAPNLPTHRIVTIDGVLLKKYLPDQAQQLEAEGVEVSNGRVDSAWFWAAEHFQELGDE
jgi:alkylated DNA nucleotide flippase Atl1